MLTLDNASFQNIKSEHLFNRNIMSVGLHIGPILIIAKSSMFNNIFYKRKLIV